MADALHFASDHLPLYCDFVFDEPSVVPAGTPEGVNSFILEQNFPNPFNPTTVISWQLAVGSDVELAVYNQLGQKVATLVSEYRKNGYHWVQWDASGHASGVYFYRLTTGSGFVQTKKLLLIK